MVSGHRYQFSVLILRLALSISKLSSAPIIYSCICKFVNALLKNTSLCSLFKFCFVCGWTSPFEREQQARSAMNLITSGW